MSEFIKMKLAEARAKFENLDEISKETMGGYVNKAAERIGTKGVSAGLRIAADEKSSGNFKDMGKRQKGIAMAVKKLAKEEAEELDENDALKRQIDFVKRDASDKGYSVVRRKAAREKLKTLQSRLKNEEAEELEELSKGTLNSYVIKSLAPSSEKSISNLASKGGFEQGERGDTDSSAGEKEDAKAVKRSLGVLTAVRKLAKEESEQIDELKGDQHKIDANKNGKVDAHDFKLLRSKNKVAEESEACMTNTSMGGADQIAQSKVGEIYKKPSKSVDAMNATAVNKRVPAVESAILDVMAKTFEKRKMFEDASNIAIISPEQRQDWLNVSTGSMEVVDYFNKYKV
jgi:hypothetical protein